MSREIDQKWQQKWVQERTYDVDLKSDGPRFYLLSMFPYPSGNLHIGHWYALAPADAYARFQRMHGLNVFFPMGFDAFGLPAENAAIKHGFQPAEWTEQNIARMTEQLKTMGCMFPWKHTLKTCHPDYYKWNQWFFLQFYEKGLVYRDNMPVDFCPQCQTTIAKEQIVNGKCERCSATVIEKEIPSWKLRITKYKDELLQFHNLDWPEKVVKMQTKWIENLKDWNVSRQRMWGTPIPMIHCVYCGIVPVPTKDLPVLLPDNAEFLPTGESPLKRHPDFKKCICPKCGFEAERETDTLDTFFCSSWYQYAYLNPYNKGPMPYDFQLANYWTPVDLYTGGIEHACMHLLYFRFFTKAMIDCGLLLSSQYREPAPKLFNQGMILGPDGQKMAKSRGNVIDPDVLVEEYGADVVRASLMFIGPWDQGGSWNTSLTGIERFLNDVDDIASRPVINNDRIDPTCAVTKAVNRTCQRVHKDYEAFKFNLVISWLMQLRNVMLENYEATPGHSWQNAVECLLLMLAPICPHRTEEAWRKTHEGSIHQHPFPARIAIEAPKTYMIVVQVNGKKKLVLEQMDGDDLTAVQQYPEVKELVKELVKDLEVIRVVTVPNKILNFVVKQVMNTSNWKDFYIKLSPLKQNCLYTNKKYQSGDIIFQFTGEILPIESTTPFALQISENLALESDAKIDDNLNHSCDPNCRIFFEGDLVLLVALKEINENEELTFNYNTTEYDMTKQNSNFVCHCGSNNCIGEIKGFTHLSPEKKQELAPYLSPFLASRL